MEVNFTIVDFLGSGRPEKQIGNVNGTADAGGPGFDFTKRSELHTRKASLKGSAPALYVPSCEFDYCQGENLFSTDKIRSWQGWLSSIVSSISLLFRSDRTSDSTVQSLKKKTLKIII